MIPALKLIAGVAAIIALTFSLSKRQVRNAERACSCSCTLSPEGDWWTVQNLPLLLQPGERLAQGAVFGGGMILCAAPGQANAKARLEQLKQDIVRARQRFCRETPPLTVPRDICPER